MLTVKHVNIVVHMWHSIRMYVQCTYLYYTYIHADTAGEYIGKEPIELHSLT